MPALDLVVSSEPPLLSTTDDPELATAVVHALARAGQIPDPSAEIACRILNRPDFQAAVLAFAQRPV